MNQYGLIGYPLTHSFSEQYFSEKFRRENIEDCTYELFPLENIEDIRFLFEINKNLKGLNVTIPYKESVIEFLDALDPVAQIIGAVNCIKIDEIQKVGYNTDYIGFRESISPLLQSHHTKALILGTGGSSKAIKFALSVLNIETKFVSRKNNENNFTYHDLTHDILEEFPLIINCTPLGTYPNIELYPDIPYSFLTKNNLLFDLVYNPEKSMFLQMGEAQGATIKNGFEMLAFQADAAWKIWNSNEEINLSTQ